MIVKKSKNLAENLPSAGNILQAFRLRAANDCFDI